MKKFVSAMLSAAIAASSLGTLTANAVNAPDTDNDMVIFGDSIAAGYGLDKENEYNYGEICGNYLGGNVDNYAVSGHTSEDMLKVIEGLSDEQKTAVKNAEYVVISIGGNDLMHYATSYILDYAAKKNFLNDGVDPSALPADPGVSALLLYLDMEKFKEYAASGVNAQLDLTAELQKLCNGLRVKADDKGYPGIIPETVIPNIETAVNNIKAINPDTRVIVQTIYQPVQLDPEYVNETYGEGSDYADLIGIVRSKFEPVLASFSSALSEINGIEIADVYYQFTSIPEGETKNNANPGHCYYFTNIQLPGQQKDFHPNQKGHLAIASTILNTIGSLHDDSGLLSAIYKKLSDSSEYPSVALDTYKTAAGNITLGDINFDDKTDARDASIALTNYAVISGSEKTILSNIQNQVADVNKDGSSDAKDASAILRYYAYISNMESGTIEEFLGL